MNKNYTLKELDDMFAFKWRKGLADSQNIEEARMLALRHVFDVIGYEFFKDEEREAFDAWWETNKIAYCNEEHAFQLWKAGREELRKAQSLDKQSAEPAWIPWSGGKCPIPENTECEVMFRCKVKGIGLAKKWYWDHNEDDCFYDLIAYRILK